ncbi:MAG: DUF455 family protein, partial [Polyangiaceae bacterium]
AWDYVHATDLGTKLAPPPRPPTWEVSPPARRILRPGRPPELICTARAAKSPGPEAIRSPAKRAQLVHTFLHHELQAAELMCWALLAFPETPRAFRIGLLRVMRDEVRHMNLYLDYLTTLDHRYGSFEVRDWFWDRVPQSETATHFAAAMGMGFEGANLDHTLRFAERFRAVGDTKGAELQEKVCAEEIPHVRFAVRWFERWRGESAGFEDWMAYLPRPLSPMVMRGLPLNLEGRLKSGFSEPFLEKLAGWSPVAPGF